MKFPGVDSLSLVRCSSGKSMELYMERMVLYRDLTGLKSLAAKKKPNVVVVSHTLALEALKESQLQGNIEPARHDLYTITPLGEAFEESNTRRLLLALCQVGDTEDL